MVSPAKLIPHALERKDKQEQSTQQDTGVNNMKCPNVAVEVFLSLVKYFLIFIVLNNLIWAGIYSYTLHKASSDTITSTEMWQDGTNNKQSITNG